MRKLIQLFILITLISCEEIIYPQLGTNTPILVVDAWLDNNNKSQVIQLSTTQNYLDSSSIKFISHPDFFFILSWIYL